MGALERKLPFTSDFVEDQDLLRLVNSIREAAFGMTSKNPEFIDQVSRYGWLTQAARHGYFLGLRENRAVSYVSAMQSFHHEGYGAAFFHHLNHLREGNHMPFLLRMIKLLIANDLEEAHAATGGDYPLDCCMQRPLIFPSPDTIPGLDKYLRVA